MASNFVYNRAAPWYHGADGQLYQATRDEDGWQYSNAARDDEGIHVSNVDNGDPAVQDQINQRLIAMLGYNPNDKRVNGDDSVSVFNPQTNAYETGVGTSAGNEAPIGMAGGDILSYLRQPKEAGQFSQFMEPIAYMAAMAAGGNLAGGGLNGLSSMFAGGEGVGAGSLFDAAVDGGAIVNGTGFGSGVASAAGAGAGAGAAGMGMGEEAMLNAARASQLDSLAGKGMTGMFSGISGGAGGAAMSLMDKLGIGGSGGMTALSTGASLLGSAAGGVASGGYQIPWDKIIGGGMEYLGQQNYADKMAEAMKYAVDKADPFSAQRPFYQDQLKSMYTDPNYFNNQPLLKGANDNAINDTTRSLASRGYNMSGNEQHEVAQRLQNNNMTYGLDLMNKTGGYAGAGFGPGYAGMIASQGGTAAANADRSSTGALGSIFQNVWNGQQPTAANQVMGQQPNQNLYSALFS